MKLLVKTITGGKFEIEVEDSHTVAQVKTVIETQKSDLPAANQKLIFSGKVLKDEEVLSEIGIKENAFLVVMVAKAKKKAAAPAPAAAAASSTATEDAKPTTAATTTTAAPAPAATGASTTTTSTTTAPAPAAPAADNFPPEVVGNLTAMGFPEQEVRHCLRAAQGNPDLAVEFLTNGIPEGVAAATASAGGGAGATGGATTSSGGSGEALQGLRNHPQFNDLRRLVQNNPQMLQQVLAQIGQQQPELLQEINNNQALFLQIMNEPIEEGGAGTSGGGSGGGGTSAANNNDAAAAALGGGLGNPAQMAQMINAMSDQEVQQMAQMMGLSAEQLRATAQMIGQLPPEQLQQFMMQAMGGGGAGGMGGGGMGGGAGGPQVLRLTDEEMAAVDRLTAMGFERAEAAQAYLACDKNEALAANLLMDTMGDDGGFFGAGGGGGGGAPGGGSGGGGSGSGGGSGGGNNDNNNSGSGGGGGNNNADGGSGDGDEDMYD